MTNNSQNEIQIESLVAITPRIADLYNKLNEPIISNDKIEEFNSLPPQLRDGWIQKNTNAINLKIVEEINDIMFDLINAMSPIIGAQKVQGVMASQQQQSLQSAQKPTTQATTLVESLE